MGTVCIIPSPLHCMVQKNMQHIAITVYSLLGNMEHMFEVMKPSPQLLLRNVD